MDGVSAVRAYTLLAVVALLAGGWMLNEGPGPAAETDDESLMEFDSSAAPTESSSDDESGSDDDGQGEDQGEGQGQGDGGQSPQVKRGIEADQSSENTIGLPTGLLAGGGAALGSLAVGSVLFEAMRVTVLIALAAPLVARMKANRDDMLTRGRLLGYIEANAGIHFSALRDALGLANGVTAYHLHTLENTGEVISWRDGKLRRYAVATLSKEELSRIRNPIAGTRLAILEVLAESGHLGLQGSEIRTKLEISRQLLSHHLAELRSAELVEAASGARRPNWRLSDVGLDVLSTSREVARLEAAG